MKIYPKISVVTASYNQGEFIEETILSLISQGYPNLEYIIIDGGSTDRSVDIIKKYEKHIAYWVSEKDRGQCHALNKGFARATGDIMAYLNSDDKYCPWAFQTVASIFTECQDVEWLTTQWQLFWNAEGFPVVGSTVPGFTKKAFYDGRTLGNRDRKIGFVQQESTFWRRSLWEKSGGFIDEQFNFAMDYDLWARFYEHADLYVVPIPLGGFRRHLKQKTAAGTNMPLYYQETEKILARYDEIREKLAEVATAATDRRSKTKAKVMNYVLKYFPELKLSQPLGEKASFVSYDITNERWVAGKRNV